MLRRPRAETMPTQSTCFRYNSLVLDNSNRNEDKSPLTINATNQSFGSGIFDNDIPQSHHHHHLQQQHWMGDILTSPTTPTTDQLLKGDDNNTIASTFASLGLNDDASPSSSSSSARPFIHASHSYSSLQTLCENGQDAAAAGETVSYYRGEQLRSSVANLRLQQQQNRPRAQSAVEQEQQQQQRSIWSDTRNFHRPFLRSSNSSADLLEMIARQRKATATSSSPTIMNEDMQSIDSSGVWTGVISFY